MKNSAPLIYFGKTPAEIIRVLMLLTGFFVVAHLLNYATGNPSWQLERLFDLGQESNLPTWFSSVLWLIAAVAGYQCAGLSRKKHDRLIWQCVASVLLLMSIDEVAMIHENFSGLILRKVLSHEFLVRFRATNWPLLAAPIILAVFLWLGTTFRRMLKNSAKTWWLVAAGFFLVAFGGAVLEMTVNWLNHDSLEWVWQLETVFEEGLEMIGAIMIIAGLFHHQQVLIAKNAPVTPFVLPQEKKEVSTCRG